MLYHVIHFIYFHKIPPHCLVLGSIFLSNDPNPDFLPLNFMYVLGNSLCKIMKIMSIKKVIYVYKFEYVYIHMLPTKPHLSLNKFVLTHMG